MYILSGLSMLVRLGGTVLGSWLLQYGAVAANLSSLALLSIAIPILGLLPTSAARASMPIKQSRSELQKHIQQDILLQQFLPKSLSNSNTEAEAEENAVHQNHKGRSKYRAHRQRSLMAAIREVDYLGTVQRYTHLPISNPLCFIFLAIMFLNSLAMDVRYHVKTWISTRYGWPLADVGYVLSAESMVGVAILFTLPWIDRLRRRPQFEPRVAIADGASAESQSQDGGLEGERLVSATRKKRKQELRVARVSLGLGAAGALIIAVAAERAVFVLGLVVFTGAIGFPDAVRAFCTSFFATSEIQALYAAVTMVEMLGVIIGSPIWGWIFAQAYHGGSAWIGIPFGVCSVLMLCLVGLLLKLEP